MSGQVEVGSNNPQTNDSSISQTVMDQFISNGMMQMSASPASSGTVPPSMRGRDYNLPPPGCDVDTIKLFVGSIPPKYTQEILRPYFAQIGEVVEISVLEGRGSGFVWYRSREEAERAIRELDGKKPGIDPKEEHRPLEIRQARLKSDAYNGMTSANIPQLLQLVSMMQPPLAPNFQNIFNTMGNNPTMMVQFIDFMLQQHSQQTQFLQQIRDAVCKMHNVNGNPFGGSNGSTTPVASPFGTTPPAAPGLSAFGLNNGSNTNIRRSVDNHIPADRMTWNKEPLNSPMAKRTSLDISQHLQNNNNTLNGSRSNSVNNNGLNGMNGMSNNTNVAFMNMLMGQNNGNANGTPDFSALMNAISGGNGLNGLNGMNGFSQPSQSNGMGGMEALLQAQSGALSSQASNLFQQTNLGGQPNLGMMATEQQNLLAAMFLQNMSNMSTNGFGGQANGISSSPLSLNALGLGGTSMGMGLGENGNVVWSEGMNSRRSMESVPENGVRGEQEEDFNTNGKDTTEGLLRKIMEESVSMEGGQENNVPISASIGYDSWGGQPAANHC